MCVLEYQTCGGLIPWQQSVVHPAAGIGYTVVEFVASPIGTTRRYCHIGNRMVDMNPRWPVDVTHDDHGEGDDDTQSDHPQQGLP